MSTHLSPDPGPSRLPVFDPRLIGMRLLRAGPRFLAYEGQWGEDGPACVAKIALDPSRAAAARTAFRTEARMLTLLAHVRGVPRLLHLDVAGPAMVNTRARGDALSRLPAEWLRDVPTLLGWGIALAGMLGEIHMAHAFHGNLNPGNVVVDRASGEVTLVNFGAAVAQSHVASEFAATALIDQISPFGAPEQTGRMGRSVDHRADLYSFGALLYWALTGRAPFVETEPLALLHALLTQTPPAPDSLNPQVPGALSAILTKLLAKDPQQRYQSAHGVGADLRQVQAALARPDDSAPFVAGTCDQRVRLAQPSRLFGRAAELARLTHALDAGDARGRVALIHGFSGAGKTALARALVPLLNERGGHFADGRFDEYQRLTPFSGLADALATLAECWLSQPPAQLEHLRRQLHQALGSDTAALLRLAPTFAQVLWPPGDVPAADPSTPLNMPRRLRQALAAVLRVIRQRGVPVVLFVDNLQWADAASLELFEAAALHESIAPALLIGAYRANEVDAQHPLHAMLARLHRADADLLEIAADNLDVAATTELVVDVLVGPASDRHAALEPLARALHRRTEGNAFFVMQYLRRLFDAGHLVPEPAAADGGPGRWRWDNAALDRLPGSDNLVAGLLGELERLPARTLQVAGGCACLGGAIDVEMLAAVMGRPVEQVDAWLLPLLQQDILLIARPADVIDVRGAVVRARGGAQRLRFCHDRMQQAAYALLGEAERVDWHLGIARVQSALHSWPGGPAAQRYSAANHYALAVQAITADDEQSRVFELLLAAASDAVTSGAFDTALRFVLAAESLQARGPADAARQLALEARRHRVLCGLVRHGEADASFARLTRLASGDTLVIADAIRDQGGALSVRSRWREACELELRAIAGLGIEAPGEDHWEAALETEVDALYAALAARGVDLFERAAPVDDERLEAAAMLLMAITTTAIRWHPVMSRWALLRTLRIGFEHGRTTSLPAQLAAIGLALDPLLGDRTTAYALTNSGLRLQALDPDPWRSARCRMAASLDAQFWFEPLEQALADTRASQRGLVEAGDGELLILNQIAVLSGVLETAPHLDVSLAEAEAAIAASARLGDRYGPTAFIATRQFARALAGLTAAPASFDEDGFHEADVLIAEGINFRARGRFGCYRALGAALFGDWPAALRYSEDALATLGKFLFGYHDVLLRWVHACALAQALRAAPPAQRELLRERIAPLRHRLAEHALECPHNFGHLNQLLRALLAWSDADFSSATRAFEASIDGALAHKRAYHHALALELAAEFYLAQGARGAALAYFARAFAAYEAWGAEGKLMQLRSSPLFDAASAAPPAPAANEAATPAGLDTLGLTEAAQMLARERDPEALPALLFDLVRRYAAAERGRLFWFEADGWLERAGFGPDGQWIGMLGEARSRPAGEDAVPSAVLNYLTQSLQPLLLRDVTLHAHFGHDAEVRRLGIKSIVGLPIHRRGQAVGLLYLDNRQAHTELTPQHLGTLRLIGLQFAVAFENALVHRNLEALVDEKTVEAKRAQQIAETATRAKSDFLANMSHEIRTPMTAILGMSHLALRAGLNLQQQNYVTKIERSAQSLLGIINDILDFSKIEAGKIDIEHTPFELGQVLDELASVVGLQAEEKGLEFIYALPRRLPMALIGDPLRLRQVLVNLGSNAVKFTEAGEVVVRIELAARDASHALLRFSVGDTGVGMDPAQRERLFQPFEQADSSTSRRHGGTGLGLAISHRLVGLMGGELRVLETGVRGSVFGFDTRFELQPAAAGPSAPATGAGRRALVVDANARARATLAHGLVEFGMHVAEAESGRSALQAVALARQAGTPFELVLLDGQLRDMDSLACARALRHDGAPATLLLTGALWREALLQRADEQRVDVGALLAKPFTPITLADACARALGEAPVPLAGATWVDGSHARRERLSGRRVLLVEDNEINQELAVELLGDAGIIVSVAEDGRQALAMLEIGRYDLVLMDCQMPVMDGYEATRALRGNPRWQTLPVIAMTANAMRGDRDKALEAGMNDHIPKPIDVANMFETLARWLP